MGNARKRGNRAKRDTEIKLSLGLTPEQVAKGDLRLIRTDKVARVEKLFSVACHRWLSTGKLSQKAYLEAKQFHAAVLEIEGSQIASMLDIDVIAATAGKRSKTVPGGYTATQLDRVAYVRRVRLVAGEVIWPSLLAVCALGMSVTDAALLAGRRREDVTSDIQRILEFLAA